MQKETKFICNRYIQSNQAQITVLTISYIKTTLAHS